MIDTKTTIRSKSLPRVQRLASEAARGLNERREASNVNWIALRAENERRAAAAAAVKTRKSPEADYTWLMRDVCSTPYGG